MSLNLLFVDDQPETISLIKDYIYINRPDWFVESASSTQEALNMVSQNDFDVIATDIRIDEMNGVTLASIFKSNPKTNHIPIIALTALLQEDFSQLENYNEELFYSVLLKPVEVKEIISVIDVLDL